MRGAPLLLEVILVMLVPGLMVKPMYDAVHGNLRSIRNERLRISLAIFVAVAASLLYSYYDYPDFFNRCFAYFIHGHSESLPVPSPGPGTSGSGTPLASETIPMQSNRPIQLAARDQEVRSMLGTWCNNISKDRIWLEGSRLQIQNTITMDPQTRRFFPEFKDGPAYEIKFFRNGPDFYYEGVGHSRAHIDFNPDSKDFLTLWSYQREGNGLQKVFVEERRC